jgi:hypothetical protein
MNGAGTKSAAAKYLQAGVSAETFAPSRFVIAWYARHWAALMCPRLV